MFSTYSYEYIVKLPIGRVTKLFKDTHKREYEKKRQEQMFRAWCGWRLKTEDFYKLIDNKDDITYEEIEEHTNNIIAKFSKKGD